MPWSSSSLLAEVELRPQALCKSAVATQRTHRAPRVSPLLSRSAVLFGALPRCLSYTLCVAQAASTTC